MVKSMIKLKLLLAFMEVNKRNYQMVAQRTEVGVGGEKDHTHKSYIDMLRFHARNSDCGSNWVVDGRPARLFGFHVPVVGCEK